MFTTHVRIFGTLKMACARNCQIGWLIKSNFEPVGIKFVRCFVVVQNVKRFA